MTICCTQRLVRHLFDFLTGFINSGLLYFIGMQLYYIWNLTNIINVNVSVSEANANVSVSVSEAIARVNTNVNTDEALLEQMVKLIFTLLHLVNISCIWLVVANFITNVLRCTCKYVDASL